LVSDERVLVDTGPLVALLDRDSEHHGWVQSRITDMPAPMLTCEPVLTEACYLARRLRGGAHAVLRLFEQGAVRLAFDLADNLVLVSTLMQRYADIPMSVADACLVRMSEIVAESVVFTLDSDFRTYRRHRRQHIPLLFPSRR
jgi:uncharacterized protein